MTFGAILEERGSFLTRVATAVVLVPLALLLIWAPPLKPLFAIAVAAMVAIGLWEFFTMVRSRGIDPNKTMGVVTGTCIALAAFHPWPYRTEAAAQENIHDMAVVLTAGLFFLAALHLFRGKHTMAGLAASAFGVVYVGWFPAHFVALHSLPQGPGLLTVLIIAVALSDTGSYLIGSAIGKHKMAPAISPNKSWEGSAGGVAMAMLGLGIIFAVREAFDWNAMPEWGLMRYLLVGAVLSIASQIGDLTESMIKRDARVKDSGKIFPGHGGVLDRFDGFLFAAPVLYYTLSLWS